MSFEIETSRNITNTIYNTPGRACHILFSLLFVFYNNIKYIMIFNTIILYTFNYLNINIIFY